MKNLALARFHGLGAPLRPWSIAFLLAALLCCCTAAFAASEDFSSGTDAAWTHSDIGFGGTQTYDASAFNYHLSATVGGFGFSYIGSFLGDPLSAFSIEFDLLSWGGGAQKLGAYARATGINTFAGVSGYMFSYEPDNGQVLIRQMTSANQAGQNLASTTFTLDVNKQYHFIFSGEDNNLYGAISEIGDPSNPVVQLGATDSTWSSGLPGVLGFGAGVPTDFTVDNFVAVVPEPSAAALLLLGGLTAACTWRHRRRQT